MNLKLMNALIHWIEVVCSVILYQSSDVPQEQRADLQNATTALTDELKKVRDARN